MKILIYIFLLFVNFLGSRLAEAAIETEPVLFNVRIENRDDFLSDWEVCADSEFGIKFQCKSNWKWRRLKDAIMIVISEKPTVTLTITRLDSSVSYLEQITRTSLEDLDLYATGFITEKVTFADQRALKVKAFSKKYPDIRLSDYYFVRNAALYGTLFSVYPKEQWPKQQYVVEKIKKSFQFMNPSDYL